MKRNRPPPSKYLRGFTSGFRLQMWVSVRGMGTPWLSLDEVISTWIKIFLIPRGYSCRHQKCRTTFLPTDIPIKCLDASGRGWTLGNHTGRKNQRMPRSFRPWHSSLYLNLASPRGSGYMIYPCDIIYYFLEILFSTRNLIHIGMSTEIPIREAVPCLNGVFPGVSKNNFSIFIKIQYVISQLATDAAERQLAMSRMKRYAAFTTGLNTCQNVGA